MLRVKLSAHAREETRKKSRQIGGDKAIKRGTRTRLREKAREGEDGQARRERGTQRSRSCFKSCDEIPRAGTARATWRVWNSD